MRSPLLEDGHGIAYEPCHARILADLHSVAHICTVHHSRPVTDHAAVADPGTILHHAVRPQRGAFVHYHLVEQQAAVSDHDRFTNRVLPALRVSDPGFLRIPNVQCSPTMMDSPSRIGAYSRESFTPVTTSTVRPASRRSC